MARLRPIGLLLVLLLLLVGCMKPNAHVPSALEVTKETYTAYINWGKSGFPTPIPDDLASKLTADSLDLMVADARWFGESGVKLHGSVEILDLKVLAQTKETVLAQIVVNDSGLEFTVDGIPRKKLRDETVTVDVTLTYDGTWKVDKLDPVGSSQS